ncbi:MAG: serine/threonine protein kinase [Deltaproteobacteria bacterium]|nr:serine/threonine protein kinase [Deltaproteobacteria bacterium]
MAAAPHAPPTPSSPPRHHICSPPVGELRPGAVFGRFTLTGVIGRGGTAEVWEASDRTLGRRVALKLTRPGSPESALGREAVVMANLAHPNIAVVYEGGELDGRPFIALELLPQTFRQWLAVPRRPDAIVTRLVQAGRGLAAAHASGVLHRDVKPDNLLLAPDGELKVSDFSPAGDAVPAIRGTPAYMAPEVLRGATADARSDQFSFAVTAWEALAGARPFAGERADLDPIAARLAAITERAFEPAPKGLPRAIERALRRALDPDPAVRFPTVDDLVRALERWRKRWRMRAAAAAALVAVFAVVVVALGRHRAPPTRGLEVVRVLQAPSDIAYPLPAGARDGSRFAVVSKLGDRIDVLDLEGRPLTTWTAPDGLVLDAAAIAGDAVIAAGTRGGAWELWRLGRDPILVARLDGLARGADATPYDHADVALYGDGALVVLGDLYEVHPGVVRRRTTLGDLEQVRISPAGRIAVIDYAARIRLVDSAGASAPLALEGPCANVRAADWADDHQLIVAGVHEGGTAICAVDVDRPANGTLLARVPSGITEAMYVTSRGAVLWQQSHEIEVRMREADRSVHVLELTTAIEPMSVGWLHHALVVSTGSLVVAFDASSGARRTLVATPGDVSLAGDALITRVTNSGRSTIARAGAPRRLAFPADADPDVLCAGFAEPPCLLATTHDHVRSFRWLDPATLEPGAIAYESRSSPVHNGFEEALSPDGRLLALPTSAGVIVVELATGATRTLASDTPFSFVAWEADGIHLIATTVVGTAADCRLMRLGLDGSVEVAVDQPAAGIAGYPRPGPGGRLAWTSLRVQFHTDLVALPR